MSVKEGGSDDCKRRLDSNIYRAHLHRVACPLAFQDVQ